MDAAENRIVQLIDQKSDDLIAFAKDIYANGEQGFLEFRTAQKVAEHLKALGLPVREHLAVTGVKSALDNGKDVTVCIIGELDGILCREHPFADRETGISHACGHHAQLTAMLGAAFALSDPAIKAALDGNVIFFAVPAEEHVDEKVKRELRSQGKIEFGSGKSELIRTGEFDDVDIALTTHAHMVACDKDILVGNNAANGFIVKNISIKGKAAHAALAPHLAVNALNAATLGLSALGMLRETFQEKDYIRIHPIIKKGGDAVNVVPDEVIIETQVRAKTIEAIREASEKTDRAFEGAAHAFGAQARIRDDQGYLPVIEREPDRAMLEAVRLLEGEISWEPIQKGFQNVASTDVGDLTHRMPVLNFTHGGVSGSLHSRDFTVTDEYKAFVIPAKLMALTVYRLLKDHALQARQIVSSFQPALSKEEYIRYVQTLINGE